MNLVRRDRLDRAEVGDVTALVDEVTAHDGVRPLSEHVMLHLRSGGDTPAHNFLLYDDTLVGYAHLDATDPVEGASGELAVRPSARRRGYGRTLVEALVADLGPQARLRLWSHGSRSGAAELARSMGFQRERVLWQMRRSLFALALCLVHLWPLAGPARKQTHLLCFGFFQFTEFNAVGFVLLAPRAHNRRIINGRARHCVDALTPQLVDVLDETRKMFCGTGGRECTGHSE